MVCLRSFSLLTSVTFKKLIKRLVEGCRVMLSNDSVHIKVSFRINWLDLFQEKNPEILSNSDPVGTFLLKIKIEIITICERLTIKTPEQRRRHRFGVFMLTLNIFHNFTPFSSIFIFDFEQINACKGGTIWCWKT